MRPRVATLLLLPIVAWADVKVEVTPGLHGLVRPHRWGYVFVQLTNTGDDTSGEVRLQLPGDTYVYTRRIDLPARKRARVNMYFRMRELQTEVTVSWVDDKAGETRLRPTPFQGGNREPYFLAAVWTARPNVQDLYLSAFVNHPNLATDELPDHWKGYDALDVLVVDAPEVSSMTPSQSKALLQWVEGGGRIVVVGEPTWTPDGIDPYLAKLLPCHVVGGAYNQVPAPDRLALDSTSTIPSVLKVALKPRAFAMRTDKETGAPLWIREARGCGLVEFLPFHPRSLTYAVKNKPGFFWGQLLIGKNAIPDASKFDSRKPIEEHLPVLLEPAQEPQGPIGTITLFALVYAVLVGPGVFWFQRKYRNVITRALTFPAVVAGATVIAFLLNAAMKMRDLGSVRLTLVYGTQDGKGARGTTWLSFISPHEGEFRITSQREGAVFSALPRGEVGVRTSDIQIVEGASHHIAMSVRPWVSETYVCEWKGDVDTGIVSHLRWKVMTATDWRLEGTIENTAKEPLVGCRVVARGRVSDAPFDIPALGQSMSVRANVLIDRTWFDGMRSTLLLLEDATAESHKLSMKDPNASSYARRAHATPMFDAYTFLALLSGYEVPFPPKPGFTGNFGVLDPLENKEFDCETLSIRQLVTFESPEVILIGWRREDVSQVDFAGQKPEGETWTMYVIRLEVPVGR